MKTIKEKIKSIPFEGNILDKETVGPFSPGPSNTPQPYRAIRPTIIGIMDQFSITQYYVETVDDLPKLVEAIKKIPTLKQPIYAFNAYFEIGVAANYGVKLLNVKELQSEPFEPKKLAVKKLKISNYDDPFFDEGKQCLSAWLAGKIEECLAHNRACLLKERDILLKRGARKIDAFEWN